MASKFEKEVRDSMAEEIGEKPSWSQVERFVDGLCEQFWATWEGVGAAEAVAKQPDVALHLMYRLPGGTVRTTIGRLLGGGELPPEVHGPVRAVVVPEPEKPKPVEKLPEPEEVETDTDLWDVDVLDVFEKTPVGPQSNVRKQMA